MEVAEQGSASGATERIEAALLNVQPIRDLARNWDIDIASCLEDYLSDLARLGHAPPNPSLLGSGGDKESSAPPNFAQAALLLQNSSSVYSRKVEYLYSLVYAALNELIASTRNGQIKNGTGKKRTGDVALEEFNAFDPEMNFLLLDDVLPTDESPDGDRINLVEPEDIDLQRYGMGMNNRTPNMSSLNMNATAMNLSLGGLSVTRLERSAHMGGAAGGISSVAAARALIGTLLNEGSDAAGGSLRLLNGRCDVSASGALLMPGSTIHGGGPARLGLNTNGVLRSPNDPDVGLTTNHFPSSIDRPVGGEEDGGGFYHDENDDDDDHMDGPGFQLATEEEKKDEENARPVLTRTNPFTKSKDDPWALLDPHNAGTSKARPLRIGVTYRLPPGLEDTPSASVNGARTKKRPKMKEEPAHKRASILDIPCVATATFKATLAEEREAIERRRSNSSADGDVTTDGQDVSQLSHGNAVAAPTSMKVPLRGLAFGNEFAYIAKAHAKRKAAERREQRKLVAENPLSAQAQAAAYHDDFDDDNDDAGGFNFGGNDDDDNITEQPDENDMPLSNVGMTSLDDAFADGNVEHNDGDSVNYDAQTFEALCRAHIKAFARGAEKYASETNLTRRVGKWQSRLSPILEEEEKRPEFNIHNYGNRILNTVKKEVESRAVKSKGSKNSSSSVPKTVDFHQVTKNSEPYEVCRLFLSSLMLCNSGNIVLSHDEACATVQTPDTLRIELLESQIDSPMETYMAPSVSADDKENISILPTLQAA